MKQGDGRVSTWPIWAGGVFGLMLGVGQASMFVALPLGLAIGYLIYARANAQADHARLRAQVDELGARLQMLEQARVAGARMQARAPIGEGVASGGTVRPVADLDLLPLQVEPTAQPAMRTATPSAEPMPAPATSREAATARRVEASAPLSAAAARRSAAPARPSAIDAAIGAARAWLLGGNTVARIGLLLLFIGVAFLLRYVAEHTDVPIEWRLSGIALAATALLLFGWRLRAKRPGYAITLQGGAIGILYLTVFAAMRLYGVLPPLPAFGLLAALAVLSGILAIAQDARALAALGAAGGFLAPILVSTGAGRIELLLGYYLLLNLGVLGIAWFRAWRELNWIGFVFTFGVLGAWVVQHYVAERYALAQAFLAAFWLLFLVVSLLYALRQPQRSRGLFDTTLMFALPLAAFGIQSRLTEGVELALAAVIAASAYLASSAALLRRGEASLRLLAEASFGVGVAFLTLAVPLAASAQWTAAAWALEGVALIWVGMRQQRLLPIAAGLLLHVAGAVALAADVVDRGVALDPALSGLTLNLLVFALTAFASHRMLARAAARDVLAAHAPALRDWGPWGARLVGWGWVAALLWQPLALPWYVLAWCVAAALLVAACRRSDDRVPPAEWVAGVGYTVAAWFAVEFSAALAEPYLTAGLRIAVAATAVGVAWLSLDGSRLQRNGSAGVLALGVLAWLMALMMPTWMREPDPMRAVLAGFAIVVVGALALLAAARRLRRSWPVRLSWLQFAAHVVVAATAIGLSVTAAKLPGDHYGLLVWPVAWGLYYLRLRWDEGLGVRPPQPAVLHVAGVWLLTAMVAAELALRADRIAGDGWYFAVWGAAGALALWLLLQGKLRWPMRAAPVAYARIAAPGLAGALLGWIVLASVRTTGDPAPLAYVPLLNPLDVATLLALFAALRWHLEDQRPQWRKPVRVVLGLAAFLALNAAALRGVHFLAGVPWTADALGRSLVVQAVLSLLWTVTAMALMVIAHRRALRVLWLTGAALLGAVVLKLFVVDLSGQGTIEQIVSFVGVGALILLIGYLAPVPPASTQARSAA